MDVTKKRLSGRKPATKKAKKRKKPQMMRVYDHLTRGQNDILGEIANISMGNAATTLNMMLGRTVNITTPRITMIHRSEALNGYEGVCNFVHIQYVEGLAGSNVFVLKDEDMLRIADLMMGGDGTNTDGEINEMHMSAASEAMNQMMGASATAMSSMLGNTVDISTPTLSRIDVESVRKFENIFASPLDFFVRIEFNMEIAELVDSAMVQLYPIQFAMEMVQKFRRKGLNRKDVFASNNTNDLLAGSELSEIGSLTGA